MIVRAGQIIQVHHVDSAKFLGNPNDNPRYQHDTNDTCKKVGSIANSYDRRMLVDFDQIRRWIVQWKCNSNLEQVVLEGVSNKKQLVLSIPTYDQIMTTGMTKSGPLGLPVKKKVATGSITPNATISAANCTPTLSDEKCRNIILN